MVQTLEREKTLRDRVLTIEPTARAERLRQRYLDTADRVVIDILRTLLLGILKTLILKYFSSLSFLILDEPIEHLDEENRNIIIDYILNNYRFNSEVI